jgi:hypothetical protein
MRIHREHLHGVQVNCDEDHNAEEAEKPQAFPL